MFTGIVEEIGTVKKIARGQKAYLEIQADKIFSDNERKKDTNNLKTGRRLEL